MGSAIVWLGWFGAFVVLELLGYWRLTPWTTLSEFCWQLESYWRGAPFIFYMGLSILAVHIALRWP